MYLLQIPNHKLLIEIVHSANCMPQAYWPLHAFLQRLRMHICQCRAKARVQMSGMCMHVQATNKADSAAELKVTSIDFRP